MKCLAFLAMLVLGGCAHLVSKDTGKSYTIKHGESQSVNPFTVSWAFKGEPLNKDLKVTGSPFAVEVPAGTYAIKSWQVSQVAANVWSTEAIPIEFSIESGKAMPEAKSKLDSAIKLHFKGQPKLKVRERKGEGVSNKKTNGVGKDDQVGCRWAALSALMALQEDAKQHGANAVVDIESYYKRSAFASATEYECHAGAVIIGVALKGSYVTVAK